MKNLQGLIIALALGIAAAALNWYYLSSKSSKDEFDYFIGVKPGITITAGEPLLEEHLVPVPVPKRHAAGLKDFAVPYEERVAVLNMKVTRTIPGGTLVLDQDLKTAQQELRLRKRRTPGDTEEVGIPIPVDTRTFIASLVKPGDMVSFLVPGPGTPQSPGRTEKLGPFRVVTVGNRLSSSEVMKAANIQQTQQNVITISATEDKEGNLDPLTQKLIDRTRSSGNRGAEVVFRPRD
ncbi:MAG: hypothetical protein JW818_17670 [Pirellulales bacterium]|nr:hypothetical protein [Pirellulales bacterium]